MEIRTYTNVWSTSKRLYTIGDISLPQPIPLVAAGIFIFTMAIWAPILSAFGVAFNNGVGIAIYLSVPAAAAWVGNKPIFHGKSILQYILGMLAYFRQPRVWTALRDDKDMRGEKIQARLTAWIPDSSKKRKKER